MALLHLLTSSLILCILAVALVALVALVHFRPRRRRAAGRLRFRVGLARAVVSDLVARASRGARFVLTAMPVAGGSGDDEDEKDEDEKDEKDDADKDDEEKDEKDDADKDDEEKDDGPVGELAKMRGELRKHRGTERRAKQAEAKARDLEAKLKEREDADKSEQEKAIEAARKEATTEIESKYETQRRDDKIENAVTKLALKGFKVKDGDDEKTLKFADPDDAQLRLERALRRGEISHDDIYTDGKVDTAAITEFLAELLDDNEHLQAGDSGARSRKVEGSADAGKGKADSGKEPSTADLVKEMAKS